MAQKEDRENVIQNLKDAGCSAEQIGSFLELSDQNKTQKLLELLAHQRENLLYRVHKEEKKISCLDYLVYQIQQNA